MEYVWDDSLRTGVELIDTQHKELFEKINNLLRTASEGKGGEELRKSFTFLSDYTVKHFSEEEEIQKKYKYPDHENHHKLHEAFKKTVWDLSVEWIKKGASAELVQEVQKKIGDWLVVHVKGQDIKLGAYLKSQNAV